MLSTRDPPQNERYTQTKSKGMKRYFMQMEMKKKVWVAIFLSDKTDLKSKTTALASVAPLVGEASH